jgi:lysophospholipase L1-like esterase
LAPAPDIRVCFLGDSFTEGTGDDQTLGWVGRVVAGERGRGHDLTGYNLGVRGQTGAEIAARTAAEAGVRLNGRGNWRAVVICFGANDIFLGRPAAQSAQALDGMLRWSAGQGFAAFVVAAPPMTEAALDPQRAALQDVLAQVCRDRAAPFLALPRAVGDWSAWHAEARAGDGVHPGAEGYRRVADAFCAWTAWRDWLSA